MIEGSITNRGVRNGSFYILIGAASTLLVFAGFAQSYYLRNAFGFPALSGLLQLHGLVMTLWFLLFFVQAGLISVRRTRLHRQLGVFGVCLATLMVAVTETVVTRAARRGFTAFPETVKWPGFFLLSLGILATFAVLFLAAIWHRGRGDLHKPLMVLASLSLWAPAISRLPLHFIETGSLWTSIALGDACVLTCVTIDSMNNRKLNPAFLWGGLLIFCSHPLLIWIGNTPAWAGMAAWLLR